MILTGLSGQLVDVFHHWLFLFITIIFQVLWEDRDRKWSQVYRQIKSSELLTSPTLITFFFSSLQRLLLFFFSALIDVVVRQLKRQEEDEQRLKPIRHSWGHRNCEVLTHLAAVTWWCVNIGGEEPADELTNHPKGWSVCGFQTPAKSHQLIPERTGVLVSK